MYCKYLVHYSEAPNIPLFADFQKLLQTYLCYKETAPSSHSHSNYLLSVSLRVFDICQCNLTLFHSFSQFTSFRNWFSNAMGLQNKTLRPNLTAIKNNVLFISPYKKESNRLDFFWSGKKNTVILGYLNFFGKY